MIFSVVHTIIAVFLIVAILLQMQGSGLSSAFGGGGEFYRSRQSVEKFLIGATIILSILFAVTSIVLLLPR